ncbi:unnamed protein product [Prorocentrum cordatum]|uniref:Uncharacterized protein n=1 Tax=Prorocentrum cordatum TaxID=2364126 RepID=A0ABN9UDL6_9DINO|nr:unnamed protein product [Polarella glacialis]
MGVAERRAPARHHLDAEEAGALPPAGHRGGKAERLLSCLSARERALEDVRRRSRAEGERACGGGGWPLGAQSRGRSSPARLCAEVPAGPRAAGGDRARRACRRLLSRAIGEGHVYVIHGLVDAGLQLPVDIIRGDAGLAGEAVLCGRADVLKALLRLGAPADGEDASGLRPLHYAAMVGSTEMITMLQRAGVDASTRSRGGATAMHFAAGRGHVGAVRLLVSFGATPSPEQEKRFAPAHWAAQNGHASVLKALASLGAPMDTLALCTEAKTGFQTWDAPVHIAAFHGHVAVLEVLAQLGAAHTRNSQGSTAAHAAACGGSTCALEALARLGCPIAVANHFGATPLHSAAVRGHASFIQALANRGTAVDTLTMTDEEKTGLQSKDAAAHMAAFHGHVVVLEVLAQLGAANATNSHGSTAAHSAACGGSTRALETLARLGCPIAAANHFGRTPFHDAAERGHLSVLRTLLRLGVAFSDVAQKADMFGRVPLEIAAERGHEAVAEWLVNGRRWVVVGGLGAGGIVVRDGPSARSEQLPERLGTGAVVLELALEAGRINFSKVSGAGPCCGWVCAQLPSGRALLDELQRAPPGDNGEPRILTVHVLWIRGVSAHV